MISFDEQSVDILTKEPVTIDHIHEELHDGNRFFASEFVSIANAASRYYSVVTGTKEVHFLAKVQANAEVVVRILEGSTVSVNGSAFPLLNKRRSSANTALTVCTAGATVTADGTLLQASLVGGSSPSAPGDNRNEDEIVFKINTTYTVKVTANAAANVSVTLDLYEL